MDLPSGFKATMNEQQRNALEELKSKVGHVDFIANSPDPDALLLRFFRATMEKKHSTRVFQVENWGKSKQHEGARTRIEKYLSFREKYNLDTKPAKWDYYNKLRPRSVWWDNTNKCLVSAEFAAIFFTKTDPNALTNDEWYQCAGYQMELLEQKLAELREEHGLDDRPIVIGVQNLTGLGIGARKMKTVFRIINEVLGEYHPEVLHQAYAVNAPWIFTKIYAVVKTIIDADTAAKVHVLGNTKKLTEMFDSESLPEDFGGKGVKMELPLFAREH